MARCALEGCGKKLKPPKRRFCCNRHKDRFHNIHNPRGKFAHLNPKNDEYYEWDPDDEIHPFSSEAFGD